MEREMTHEDCNQSMSTQEHTCKRCFHRLRFQNTHLGNHSLEKRTAQLSLTRHNNSCQSPPETDTHTHTHTQTQQQQKKKSIPALSPFACDTTIIAPMTTRHHSVRISGQKHLTRKVQCHKYQRHPRAHTRTPTHCNNTSQSLAKSGKETHATDCVKHKVQMHACSFRHTRSKHRHTCKQMGGGAGGPEITKATPSSPAIEANEVSRLLLPECNGFQILNAITPFCPRVVRLIARSSRTVGGKRGEEDAVY